MRRFSGMEGSRQGHQMTVRICIARTGREKMAIVYKHLLLKRKSANALATSDLWLRDLGGQSLQFDLLATAGDQDLVGWGNGGMSTDPGSQRLEPRLGPSASASWYVRQAQVEAYDSNDAASMSNRPPVCAI